MTNSGFFNRPGQRIATGVIVSALFAVFLSAAHAGTHVVRRGESLSRIAAKYKVGIDELMRANKLKSRNRVNAGVRLVIPEKKASTASAALQKHTVRKGETLSEIATKYGTTVNRLTDWNELESPSHIDAGEVLFVSEPPKGVERDKGNQVHVVRKGEALGQIAEEHGVGLSVVAKANHIRWPYRITPGQEILIPGGGPGTTSTARTVARPEKTIRIIVQKRETLEEIADRYGVSVEAIAEYNGIRDPDEIYVGQRLIVPGRDAAPKIAIHTDLRKALDRIPVRSGRWKYIVIHHSATRDASAKGMDAYHRARGMENGLAYHFVIGRGGQMQDGSTYVGNRWKKQLDGGHLAKASLNAKSVGICLVGDFTTQTPTALQMRSLNGLVDYLLARCRLKVDAVTTHRQIHPRHTACPGKKFPVSSFEAGLKKRN